MLNPTIRRGVSLVELLVVLAIVGVAAGAVARVGTHQQRQYGRLAARSLALAQLRDGGDVLASALADIAPRHGDLHDDGLEHASLSFRLARGSAALCGPAAAGANEIDIVSLAVLGSTAPAGDDQPAGWIVPGDSIWIHDAASDTAAASDPWHAHAVVSTTTVRGSCAPADGDQVTMVRAVIRPGLRAVPEVHAPARVFRRARYALYRAGDGRWYLGFSDCLPGARAPACAPMQPVAGPYLPDAGAASARRGGLQFEYLDSGGAPTDDPAAVAIIVVRLRALASPSDTVAVQRTVGLRNATR